MEEENPLFSHESSEETELKRIGPDKQNFENRQVSIASGLPEGKKYHLFVSCSSNDIRSVEPILETLKDCYNIKCVNPENFIAGKPVLQNISDLMVESMKFLIVMSPNYLQSNFCNYEKCLAFFMHAGERRHCLIPLLLEPCDNLPVELKQLTYIDAATTQDIPARIVDALRNNDAPNCLLPENIPESVLRTILRKDFDEPSRDQNGYPLFFMFASKLTAKKFGNQWYFKSLTKTDLVNMDKENIKMGEFYEKLIADLNSQRLLMHFGALTGGPQLILMLFLSVVAGIFSFVGIYSLVVLITGVYEDMSAFYIFFIVVLIFILVIVVIFGRKLLHIMYIRIVQNCIWKHMKTYYETGKFLIFYHEDNKEHPSNHLVAFLSRKYHKRSSEILEQSLDELERSSENVEGSPYKLESLSENVEGSSDELERSSENVEGSSDELEPSSDKLESLSENVERPLDKLEHSSGKKLERSHEELQSLADSLIESKITGDRQRLYSWCTLPSSISKRHNTYLGKKCLCELIEDSLYE